MKKEKIYTNEELEELLAKLPNDVLCKEYDAMTYDMFYAWGNDSCEQVQELLSKHGYNLDSIQLVRDVFYALNNLVEGEIEYGNR
ncbi:hypothetical protein [Enterococcus phage TJE2]|uniref:Uncharacterized protein n=1 Tax=Enterococcus phage TJE2 TaxID=2951263 RepID=A0A976SY00_9CAUD|nr:hypothetical protein [Enterococcus phage TJE2]